MVTRPKIVQKNYNLSDGEKVMVLPHYFGAALVLNCKALYMYGTVIVLVSFELRAHWCAYGLLKLSCTTQRCDAVPRRDINLNKRLSRE